MDSQTTNRFWKAYNKLSSSVQKATKKIYRRWKENPYDPNPFGFTTLQIAKNNNHTEIVEALLQVIGN